MIVIGDADAAELPRRPNASANVSMGRRDVI
jgi:hypothetical protein